MTITNPFAQPDDDGLRTIATAACACEDLCTEYAVIVDDTLCPETLRVTIRHAGNPVATALLSETEAVGVLAGILDIFAQVYGHRKTAFAARLPSSAEDPPQDPITHTGAALRAAIVESRAAGMS